MILILLLVVAFSSFPSGSPSPELSKLNIVGGTVADVIPYQVSLEENQNGTHICGGVIITKNVIITAAHCVYLNPEKLRIRAGTNTRGKRGQVINVRSCTVHPNYTRLTIDYDIAVLELKNSLKLSKRVKPIKMVNVDDVIKTGTKAIISGWGVKRYMAKKGARKLMSAIVPIFDWNICKNYYYRYLTERMICAGDGLGKVDSCKMDSGGPLVADGRLIGIVSHGKGCAEKDTYGIYVNIANLREWIDKIIKYNTCINKNC